MDLLNGNAKWIKEIMELNKQSMTSGNMEFGQYDTVVAEYPLMTDDAIKVATRLIFIDDPTLHLSMILLTNVNRAELTNTNKVEYRLTKLIDLLQNTWEGQLPEFIMRGLLIDVKIKEHDHRLEYLLRKVQEFIMETHAHGRFDSDYACAYSEKLKEPQLCINLSSRRDRNPFATITIPYSHWKDL